MKKAQSTAGHLKGCMTMLCCVFALSSVWGNAYNVTDSPFSAAGNGTTNDKLAIQKAIDSAGAHDPSTVVLTGGKTFLSGTIYLKSGVTLQIDAGNTLLGVSTEAGYDSVNAIYGNIVDTALSNNDQRIMMEHTAFIYARGKKNITITGGGTIDGNANYSSGRGDSYPYAPAVTKFVLDTNVTVSNMTITNPAHWTQPYYYCDSVVFDRNIVRGWLGVRGYNDDGISVIGSSRFWITNCNIITGDDAIVIKSTACPDFGQYHTMISRDIHVLNDTVFGSTCQGIKVGTETLNNVKNVEIRNCRISSGMGGINLMTVDGGTMDSIIIQNIWLDSCGAPIFIKLGNRDNTLPNHRASSGSMSNITIDSVYCAKSLTQYGSQILGMSGTKIKNVVLKRLNLDNKGTWSGASPMPNWLTNNYPEYDRTDANNTKTTAWGLNVRHVDGLTMENCNFLFASAADDRPCFLIDSCSNVNIDSVKTVKCKKNGASAAIMRNGPTDPGKTFVTVDLGNGTSKIFTRGDPVGTGHPQSTAPIARAPALSLENQGNTIVIRVASNWEVALTDLSGITVFRFRGFGPQKVALPDLGQGCFIARLKAEGITESIRFMHPRGS